MLEGAGGQVLCTITKRDTAKHISDAIFDLLSLEKTMLTYTEFIEGACRQGDLCTVFYKMMLLQARPPRNQLLHD